MPLKNPRFIFIAATLVTALLVIASYSNGAPMKLCLALAASCSSSQMPIPGVMDTLLNLALIAAAAALMQGKIRHNFLIPAFATLEAFWIAYALIPSIAVERSYNLWLTMYAVILFGCFYGAFALFNKWSVPLTYKLGLAAFILVATAVVSDRIVVLL